MSLSKTLYPLLITGSTQEELSGDGTAVLNDRVLDSRSNGSGLESHWRHCVMSLIKTH